MLLGVIADDFTGASDIANAISQGLTGSDGLQSTIYMGVPGTAAVDPADAGVIALKSRSIPAEDAVRESLQALEWLQSQGAEQIVFKYCSTFDSTADGNIGPVAEALAEQLGEGGVVACPAFPENGRTVYQGHLFVHDRLLNESGLENHPLNPMTDSDIRRWLQLQSRSPVGHLPLSTVHNGPAAVTEALARSAAIGERLVITDAVENSDVATIGVAVKQAALVTGGSAIASALPQNFPAASRQSNSFQVARVFDGPGVILAGSCSQATRGQIEAHTQSHPGIVIDVADVMEKRFGAEQLFNSLNALRGQSPVAYSSADPTLVTDLQLQYGTAAIAQELDRLFGDTAVMLKQNGYRRIVVAGGETSGAVVDALAPEQLSVGPEIDPGVPALYSDGNKDSYAIVLKSGNFGGTDFFGKALRILGGE